MGIQVKRAVLDRPGEWWEYPLPDNCTGYFQGNEQAAREQAQRITRLYAERANGAKQGKEIYTLTRIRQTEIGQRRRVEPVEDFSGDGDFMSAEDMGGY